MANERQEEMEYVVEQWLEAGLSRRHLLRFLAGGTSAAALSMVIAACGGSASSPTTASKATSAATTSGSAATSAPAATTSSSGSSSPVAAATTAPAGTVNPADIQKNVTLTIPIVTTIDITLDPQKAQNYLTLGNLYPYVYG